jgi:hypothetical protein
MSHLQRVSWILGAVLLGACALVLRSRETANPNRRTDRPPVDKLAADLQQAWVGHHTP